MMARSSTASCDSSTRPDPNASGPGCRPPRPGVQIGRPPGPAADQGHGRPGGCHRRHVLRGPGVAEIAGPPACPSRPCTDARTVDGDDRGGPRRRDPGAQFGPAHECRWRAAASPRCAGPPACPSRPCARRSSRSPSSSAGSPRHLQTEHKNVVQIMKRRTMLDENIDIEHLNNNIFNNININIMRGWSWRAGTHRSSRMRMGSRATRVGRSPVSPATGVIHSGRSVDLVRRSADSPHRWSGQKHSILNVCHGSACAPTAGQAGPGAPMVTLPDEPCPARIRRDAGPAGRSGRSAPRLPGTRWPVPARAGGRDLPGKLLSYGTQPSRLT